MEKRVTLVPKFFGDTTHLPSDELLVALSEGPKSYYIAASIDQKNHEMVAALITKLDAQKDNLKSAAALEHQNNVRKKYCEIHSLLKHPLCYGFLLHFCRNQRSDENLSFIRAVEEYREIFSSDWIGSQSLWSNDWREIDSSVEINSENLSEQSLNCDLWVSNLPKDVIHSKIESILSKYLRDDAQHQVCISKCLIARTLKRAKLLHLYGPSIFDEACMDPILTMERDVLPRFRKSDIVNTMVMRVASCEPVPPAKDLNVPPPENLLLHLCPAEAFPDTRCFTLDELIGSQHLYDSFLTFLQNISKEKGNKLLCIRKIDIFEELMHMNCVKEATEEAWQIYRYYVAQGAAFEIPISSVELVELMVSLAVPKRDMFVSVRQSAYVNLTSYFSAFVKTAAYRGLSKLMRDLKSEAPASQHGVSVSMAMASSELPLIHCRSSREDRVRVNNHKDRQENEKEIDQAVTPKISKVTMAGTLISSLSIRKLRL